MADYVPHRDQDLLTFVTNLSAKITATPVAFGLVAGDATSLAALVTAFESALSAATTPGTRTPVSVAVKDTARAALVADVRALARRIQATPTVTPAQKTELGLPIADHVPTPVPPPATPPILALLDTSSRAHTIRLANAATPTSRAKPQGATAAEVYSFVGTTPPEDLEQWRFEGLATRAEFTVDYSAGDAGKQALIVARWVNRKGQPGPTSAPITGTVAA